MEFQCMYLCMYACMNVLQERGVSECGLMHWSLETCTEYGPKSARAVVYTYIGVYATMSHSDTYTLASICATTAYISST